MREQECCLSQGVKEAGLAFVGSVLQNEEHRSCREDSKGVKIIKGLVRICFTAASLYFETKFLKWGEFVWWIEAVSLFSMCVCANAGLKRG